MRTVLLFVDGLGWGPPSPETNAQYSYGGEYFRLPPTGADPVEVPGQGLAVPLDAILGVPGVPQSATGQTTLLSGVNAQQQIGRHLTGFPNEPLREILRRHSLLKTLTDRQYQARFLNTFRPRFWELSEQQQWTLSATTVATLAAGVPFFNLEDLKAGRSVYQEFTHQELIQRGFEVALRTPAESGRIVARQSGRYDFTLFEYFQTDRAGHSGQQSNCEEQLRRLDEFLHALLEEKTEDTLVVLTSDHGNLEDSTTRHHTLNPVPLMVWGAGKESFLSGCRGLDQVAGAILARHPSARP